MTIALRRTVGGVLVLIMMLGAICGGLLELFAPNKLLLFAGCAGWLAGLLLVSDVSRTLQIQVALLVTIGVLLMWFAAREGAEPDYHATLTANVGLLTMVTAVGFLRMVAMPANEKRIKLPVGRSAYTQTLLSTSLFGSVINISAPIIIADRIDEQRPMLRFTSQSITRVFSGCASWSPFFAGMAVVLTYIKDAQLVWIMLAGLPFAAVGLIMVYSEALLRYHKEVSEFVGYPMRLANLWVPILLALSVALFTWVIPDLSILMVIALSALLLTVLTLLKREGVTGSCKQLQDHIANRLPRTVNELVLFLAAGTLASGIAAMLQTGILQNPITTFDAISAIQLFGLMVVVAAMGIHPVILISGFTPLILTVEPNPNLLALTYLFAWSLGTCASPLSGTHLVFQGRYGIPSWKGAMWNWPYVVLMYLLGAGWLWVVASKI